MIPDALERRALYNRRYDACESVKYHIGHDNMHRLPKLFSGEDAQIEETDRGLCQGNGEFVQDLSSPECLRRKVRTLRQVEWLLPLGIDLLARLRERRRWIGLWKPCQPRERRLCTA